MPEEKLACVTGFIIGLGLEVAMGCAVAEMLLEGGGGGGAPPAPVEAFFNAATDAFTRRCKAAISYNNEE